MDDFESLALEETVRFRIGKAARARVFGREPRSPMNLVLEEAERQSGSRLVVYGVEEGLAQTFYLSGFSVTPIVFNSRYLELVYLVRRLFTPGPASPFREELAEGACYEIMADLALRGGDPEFAVRSFLRSVLGRGIRIPGDDMVMDLEAQPLDEAYMTTWFFGLVHEIGHIVADRDVGAVREIFPDEWMHSALRSAFERFPYPDAWKEAWIRHAGEDRSGFALGLDHLRGEGRADLFAVNVLFQATTGIMAEAAGKPFDVGRFVQEVFLFLNAVSLVERCQTLVRIADAARHGGALGNDLLLHPVAMVVRATMVQNYLTVAVAGYLSGRVPPPQEQVTRVWTAVDEIGRSLGEALQEIDRALGTVIRFAGAPRSPEDEEAWMTRFRDTLPRDVLLSIETRRFCERAETLGVTSASIQALRDALEAAPPG